MLTPSERLVYYRQQIAQCECCAEYRELIVEAQQELAKLSHASSERELVPSVGAAT